jgi:probable HAF family extracellular repeat protein
MPRTIFRSCRVTFSVILFVLYAANASATVTYHLTDLGTFGGSDSFAMAINNSGQVVGSATSVGYPLGEAFRTKPNSVINPATDALGALGGDSSAATAINELGQVAGTSTTGSVTHAFRTAPNAAINPVTDNLGTLGGQNTYATGINDLGQVVGSSSVGTSLFAYCTSPNAAINPATDNLGGFGGTNGEAWAINNSGQIVGGSNLTGDSVTNAFRIDGRKSLNVATDDIGKSVGGGSFAYAINSTGQVAGSAMFGGALNSAFRISPGAAINPLTDNLGRPTGSLTAELRGINEIGWAVGITEMPSVIYFALLYDGTTLINLNNVLDSSGAGWNLTVANDINDHNQIVGYGTIHGQTHAFRLDVVPEPSTISLWVVALAAFCTRRRKSFLHNRV